MQQVFLSPTMGQHTGFGQVMTIDMLRHLFRSYEAIGYIDLEENAVKMMGPYYPAEPLVRIIDQLKKGREFSRPGGQMIEKSMMVSKLITLLA